MKKIALLLLLLFTTVQVVPMVKACFSDHATVLIFNIDEEKQTEKTSGDDQKDKKEYTVYLQCSAALTQRLNTALHHSDRILPAPCMEMMTPPPNC